MFDTASSLLGGCSKPNSFGSPVTVLIDITIIKTTQDFSRVANNIKACSR